MYGLWLEMVRFLLEDGKGAREAREPGTPSSDDQIKSWTANEIRDVTECARTGSFKRRTKRREKT
jgi:hypothetical protein